MTRVNALEGLVVGSIYLLPPDPASSIAESGDPAEKSGATRRRPAEGSMEFLMQLINSRTLLEEVNENNLTMEPLNYPVRTPPVVELPARTVSSADGQICAEG